MTVERNFSPAVKRVLRRGGVGVIPTDTIYGIVGLASRPDTVERIYVLRYRKKDKPMIVLVSDIGDLGKFGVSLDARMKKTVKKLWRRGERPTSIILPIRNKWEHIHRGKGTIAFRVPQLPRLCRLVREVGPLVAPSANVEGRPPARNMEEAQAYFNDAVDFYVDGGRIIGRPSRLVSIEGEKLDVLRD